MGGACGVGVTAGQGLAKRGGGGEGAGQRAWPAKRGDETRGFPEIAASTPSSRNDRYDLKSQFVTSR